jgi:nucleoid-associated protein YgaU
MRLLRHEVARRVRRSRIVTSNRLFLATSVLVAGVAAAWPFRHPKPSAQNTPAVAAAPVDLPLRRQEVRLDVSPLAETSPAVGLEQVSLKLRKTKPLVPVETKPVAAALESLGSPPALGQMYESLMKPTAPAEPPRSRSPYQDVGLNASAAPPVMVNPYASVVPPRPALDEEEFRPKLKEHRIVDGDTLELLAQRYLGDPQRAEEIFELNRDRLQHPDLLPVGKRLRIPQRREPVLTPVARSDAN